MLVVYITSRVSSCTLWENEGKAYLLHLLGIRSPDAFLKAGISFYFQKNHFTCEIKRSPHHPSKEMGNKFAEEDKRIVKV